MGNTQQYVIKQQAKLSAAGIILFQLYGCDLSNARHNDARSTPALRKQ